MSYRNYAKLYQTCNGTLAANTSSRRFIIPASPYYQTTTITLDPEDEKRAGLVYLNAGLPVSDVAYRFVDTRENYNSSENHLEEYQNPTEKNDDFFLIEFNKSKSSSCSIDSGSKSGSCGLDSGSKSGSCGLDSEGKSICGGGGNLYPILDPRFNLRESAKHLILLEDHLFHEGKRCRDCILKHLLTIEGFLEEAVTLDKEGKYVGEIQNGIQNFRKVFKIISHKLETGNLSDEECCQLAQRLRVIRKPLCQNYATFLS
jgi:hypothetical protein